MIVEIDSVYRNIIEPFEAEDEARKTKAAEEKRKFDEMITEQRAKISGIRGFTQACIGQDSDFISNQMEAVNLIDPFDFHKDLAHEAEQAKKETISTLHQMRTDAITRENLAKDKAKLEREREEFNAWKKSQQEPQQPQAVETQPEVEQATQHQSRQVEATTQTATRQAKTPLEAWAQRHSVSDQAMKELYSILNQGANAA